MHGHINIKFTSRMWNLQEDHAEKEKTKCWRHENALDCTSMVHWVMTLYSVADSYQTSWTSCWLQIHCRTFNIYVANTSETSVLPVKSSRVTFDKILTLTGTALRISRITPLKSRVFIRMSGTCMVHDGAFGWGTKLQVGRSRVLFPMVSLEMA